MSQWDPKKTMEEHGWEKMEDGPKKMMEYHLESGQNVGHVTSSKRTYVS